MGFLSIIVAVASILGSWAYSGGARDCGNPGHGTFQSTLPSGMTLSLIDTSTAATTTQWSAGKTYTVQIQSTSSFKGWSWAPLIGTPASFTAGSANMAGSFAAGDSYSHVNTGCPGSITQTNGGTSRTLIKATWTAPAAGTGTVSLWALIVVSKGGNNYNAVQTVTELVAGASPSAAAAASPSATATRAAAATRTHTVAASASRGASTSATSTSAVTATETATETASVSQTTGRSVSSTPAAAVPVPVVAPAPAATASNTANTVPIAIGSAIAGATFVAVIAIFATIMNKQQKRPFQYTPTVIVNTPVPQNNDSNPYMVNVSRTKMAFTTTQAHV